MRRSFVRNALAGATLLAAVVAPWACGGSVTGEGDGSIDAGAGVRLRPYPEAGTNPSDASSKLDANRMPDVVDASRFDAYREPSCPNVPPPAPVMYCDPLGENECDQGLACFPFPPQGTDPCNPGPYTMRCALVGSAGQGERCTNGSSCMAGHVCAVTAQGDQCLKLCRVGAIEACTDGRICARLDLPGLGGCL